MIVPEPRGLTGGGAHEYDRSLLRQGDRSKMKHYFRRFSLFLVFSGLGLLGNSLHLPLFFGLDFLSGNIFVFLAVALLGTRAGAGVALIAGSYTYFFWGNPYSWLGMVVQALLVGWGIRYKRPSLPRNMPVGVLLYWLLLGLPLIAGLYHYALGLEWQPALMVAFKQAVNDVFNALIAALVLSYLPVRRWCGLPKVVHGTSLSGLQINLLAAFAFFPSLVVISLLSRSDVAAMEDAAKMRLAVRAAALSQHAREWVDEHMQVAQALAGQVELGKGRTDADLHRDLRYYAAASNEVVAIRVVNAEGRVRLSSNNPLGSEEDEDVSSRDWFRRLKARSVPVVAMRHGGNALDEPAVVVAAPVLKRSGELWGAVALSYKLRSFQNMFSSGVLEDDMRATLIDMQGRVIVSSASDFVPNQVFETQRGGAIVERQGDVFRWQPAGVRSNIEGWTSSYYSLQMDVGGSGWHLVVELPLKPHFLAMQDKVLQGFIVIYALAFMAFLVGTWLGRRVALPLQELGLVTAHLAQDISDAQISLPHQGLTEIDALADNFRDMAIRLRHNYAELMSVRHDLEERVAQRTADLKRQAEELEVSRDIAETASRAKTEFLSSMSHEMRTPMNAILGFSQYLQMEALTDDQKMGVDEIYKAGMHLLALIDEVLNLAKIEAGKLHLSLEPVELAPLVAECLPLVNSLAAKKGIRINYRGLDGRVVRADRVRLKQVLLNLLSNAIKYNREGGSVDLTVGARDAESLQIRVKDSGRGIPAARLHELFQPFQRLGAENGPIEGTGIGLTITRRIVELMGGTVDVESQEGVGSTFWIELPLDVVPAMAPEARDNLVESAEPTEEAAIQHSVLYIEDNPANLKLVAHILGRRKHVQLLAAHTPELGLELARLHRPELILLDINLPGMDGYQVLKILQSDEALREIPVVAVTANDHPGDIQRGREAGFADYLTKPLNIPYFNELLDVMLNDAQPGRAQDVLPAAAPTVVKEAASTGRDNWATF